MHQESPHKCFGVLIERSGRVCCIREPGTKDVRLELTSQRMKYRNAPFSEEFVWQVR